MARKLLVNLLAVTVVLLLAGASLAATTAVVDDARPLELPDPAAGAPELPAAPAPGEDAAQAQQLQVTDETVNPADDDDAFGAVRSAEVERFGACMEAAEDHDARQECRELRPGPAHENPAHPTGGPAHAPGQAKRDGESPGNSGHARGTSPGQAKRAEGAGAAEGAGVPGRGPRGPQE